jgi:hypothetical protein
VNVTPWMSTSTGAPGGPGHSQTRVVPRPGIRTRCVTTAGCSGVGVALSCGTGSTFPPNWSLGGRGLAPVNREIWPFRSPPADASRQGLDRAAAEIPACLLRADVPIASAVLILAIAFMSPSGRNARLKRISMNGLLQVRY